MIDIKELRRLAQAAIAKMNASDPEFASSTPPLAILELLDRLEAAEKERDALRAEIEAMERQVPICRAEDLRHAEIILPSLGLMPEDKLYALPGAQAQPASSIPVEAIGKMLADVMAVAVSNGANSVSMPDEYVEVAVWLQGECPTQPAPSVPEGWQLVPIEPTQEMLDATSWPNCAGTDYKKMLAAAPRSEAKP